MPNSHNIESPITLVSLGRSGTSLTLNIFARHPECSTVGETINLIFGVWHAVEFTDKPPLIEAGRQIPDDERAARAVRQTILTCFPDDKPYWFQKPIGIPRVLLQNFDDDQWNEAAEWYWKVMTHSFPGAKFFTILRHPCDVVLSLETRSARDAASTWRFLALMAYILTHPASPVEYAVHFEELLQNSEGVVRDLFDYLDLAFDQRVLEAFSQIYAPSPVKKVRLDQQVTRRSDEWDQLDPTKASSFYIEQISNLFRRFKYSLQWPSHFTADKFAPDKMPELTHPQIHITQLEQKIRELHLTYDTNRRQLKGEIQHWQNLAQERQRQITQLEEDALQLEWQVTQYQDLAQQRGAALEAIHQTRAWRLASRYWALKKRILHNAPPD